MPTSRRVFGRGRSVKASHLLGTLVLVAAVPVGSAFAQVGTPDTDPVSLRPRLGGSVGVGGGTMGLGAVASARAGIQVNRSWAASYQISASETSKSLLGDSDDWRSHTLLVEYTLPGTLFTLGGGPSYVSGNLSYFCGFMCSAPPPSTYTGFGFDWRVARTFGANRPSIRGGFTLEIAGHHTAHDSVVVFGIGADLF